MTDETAVPKKQSNREDALAVVRRLRESGHIAYFAGGCVRDQLLGLEPKDYDVATDAPPGRVRELFSNTQAVGAAFGVILVRQRKSQIEVATFRTDGKYVDGRRPETVTFATAEVDAKRRDFTINGMFFDPVEGKVIDYVGGQRDLQFGWLRAIGNPDARFNEDHLRLLRAVRFAARFGLEIEGMTGWAIKENAVHLKRISPERVAEELRRMLIPASRSSAWGLLCNYDLIGVVFRTLKTERKPPLTPTSGTIISHLPKKQLSFGTVLAAAVLQYQWQLSDDKDVRRLLGRGNAIATAAALRQSLRFSNDESDEMSEIIETLAPILSDEVPSVATRKRFLVKQHHEGALNVMRALNAVDLDNDAITMRWAALQFEGDIAPPPLVTGDDLTSAGLNPGPVFKRVLDAVYDAQLEDRVTTKEQAMRLAMELAEAK